MAVMLPDRRLTALLLVLALLLAGLGVWQASVPPEARPANASPRLFSAYRATADVRAIGRRPHPIGSDEHERVRSVLVARMAALGLTPRIVFGVGIKAKPARQGTEVEGADVANLIGTLPGSDRRAPALLLMAHYDSVPSSPGAADDGAGIAAALEIARALRAGPPLRRDIVFLFTDGEENGLLGARAFFAEGQAKRIGFVVNMDMRGGAGRAIMHETGRDSGGAIAAYRRSAIHPTTDSIAAYVERLIRNSSDFRIAADHGLAGLNYAILDRQFDYHAASSTPETLDPRSLQHLGEQVLAVTQALAAADLPARSPDPAYASVLGWFVLVYPPWAGWLILAVGAVLAAAAWRREQVPVAAGLRAAGAALHMLLTLVLLLTLARLATGIPFGFVAGRPLLAWWPYYEVALGLFAVAAPVGGWAMALAGARRVALVTPLLLGGLIVVAGGTGWIVPAMATVAALLAVPLFRTPLASATIAFGLWCCLAISALAVQAIAPVAGVVLGWSVLAGGVALFAASCRRGWGLAVVALAAALLVAQQISIAHLLLLAVGETIAGVAAPFALCAAVVLAPLLARVLTVRSAAWLAVAAAVAAGAIILAIRLGDPVSPARPGLSQIVHVTDYANHRAYRATSLASPDRWTLDALGPRRAGASMLPLYDHAIVARGEAVASAPPWIVTTRAPGGAVLVRIAGPPGTRAIRVALAASGAITGVRANGFAVPLLARPGRIDRVSWFGRDPVLILRIMPRGRGRLVARIATLRDGWPADARLLAPRPATSMPWYDSDASVTLSTLIYAW